MFRQIAWSRTTRGLVLGLIAAASQAGSVSAQQATPPPAKKAAAPAQPKPTQAQVEAANKLAMEKMVPVLAEWEKRSAKITSLDVVFDMVEKNAAFGNVMKRGRAMLESPDKACLQFQLYKLDDNGKPIVVVDAQGKKIAKLEDLPEKRIVCTGTDVLQYMWENKTITIYPLDKQIRNKALQEGPLPFLFNMKASNATERYAMLLNQEFATEYVIDIIPRLEIDRESFVQARLWLNKETFLPNQLWLVKNGGKEREEYKFNGSNDVILANQPMDQKYFKLQEFQGWKKVVNQMDAPKGQANAPAPANLQPRQQSMQPGGRAPAR